MLQAPVRPQPTRAVIPHPCLSYRGPHQAAARAARARTPSCCLGSWEHAPEAQGLIPCPCHNGLSVRCHSQVQHSVGVSGQGGKLGHAGVLPHIDLVLAVAVGRHQLIHVLGPGQLADLQTANRQMCDCIRTSPGGQSRGGARPNPRHKLVLVPWPMQGRILYVVCQSHLSTTWRL